MTKADLIALAERGPRINSSYAIVDIERGRKALMKHLAKHGPVRVIIEATLTDPFGQDDGVSVEFNANVHSIRYASLRAIAEEMQS